MDQIEGALARFTAARRDEDEFEEEAAADLIARRSYTVDRVMAHTNAVALIRSLIDAATVLDDCVESVDGHMAIRVRHNALALRDWIRWIAEDESRVKGEFE